MSQQPNRPNLDDYVPVHERIAAFYEKFPEGSLQAELVVHTENMIAMVARAFRTPDDARPGVGHSSIEVPGRTPYTRGSEMENCETSAWGRAIAALGFEIKRGIATQEEVANKSESAPRATQKPVAAPKPVPVAQDTPELSEDDWAGLFDDNGPKKPAATNGNGHAEGLSTGQFFERVKAEGIDSKKVSATAKQMFGADKWSVKEHLTDSERAALLEELTA